MIALAILIGVALCFTPIDSMQALYRSTVINAVIAVPVMLGMMLIASSAAFMDQFTICLGLKIAGWICTIVMSAAVIAMFWTFSMHKFCSLVVNPFILLYH